MSYTHGKRKMNEVMVGITSSAGMCMWPCSFLGHCLAELEEKHFQERWMEASSLTLLQLKGDSWHEHALHRHTFYLEIPPHYVCRILCTPQTTFMSTVSLNSHIVVWAVCLFTEGQLWLRNLKLPVQAPITKGRIAQSELYISQPYFQDILTLVWRFWEKEKQHQQSWMTTTTERNVYLETHWENSLKSKLLVNYGNDGGGSDAMTSFQVSDKKFFINIKPSSWTTALDSGQ